MSAIETNEAVNLDSSGVIELGRLATYQTPEEKSADEDAPEFSGHGSRCDTQERELLSCEFEGDSAADRQPH